MFVAGTQVYWSEFKVMYEALRALGYAVDVRSSHANPITAYSADGDIAQSAAGLGGGSYAAFKADFAARFGATFSDAWAPVGVVTPSGRIQDVPSVAPYAAVVLVGGLGALEYRLDGTYAGAEQQAAAVRLNALATEALASGVPVLAQCHAATLPAFFRVPGTSGQGPDGLGVSVLQGRSATAYHLSDGDSAARFAALGVTYRSQDSVVVDGPVGVAALADGAFRVITSRDWYPQTVAHAAATLHTHLRSTPAAPRLHATYSVLVLHGGPLDTSNCSASNRLNDVPCNYGTAALVLPADSTHVQALLLADAGAGAPRFTVSALNLADAGSAFDPASATSVATYAAGFDAVLFFKHWNTYLPTSLQQGLARYVDDGGGLVALHHGLYDDQANGLSKATLVSLFGASSSGATFSARDPSLGPYPQFNVNAGHFITTFGVAYDNPGAPRGSHLSGAAPANVGPLVVPSFAITDELYLNHAFVPGVVFGSGVNQVQTLFANGVMTTCTQAFTSGFARLRDLNGDGVAGRVVYLQVGERRANYAVTSPAGQAVRNALVWAAQ